MLTKGNTAPMFYRILQKFPPNFSFCFAYGSGVKKQLGYNDVSSKKNMIDLIYCVENPHRWHSSNLEKNPHHYSGLKYLGSQFISKYQEELGAKVYCNTLISIEEENVIIKYGVISSKDLVEDLMDWNNLYIAGRLHKPVEIIRNPTSSKIQNAVEANLKSAAHAALLMLPEKFTEFEFYRSIANLSYAGDFRMVFGENKEKVNNIVRPQLQSFKILYSPTIKNLREYLEFPVEGADNSICKQDLSRSAILHHLNNLPKWPIRRIVLNHNLGRYRQDTDEVLRNIASSSNYRKIVGNCLGAIVWQSSVKQSIKNIPTAGVTKAIKYGWEKSLKTFESPKTQGSEIEHRKRQPMDRLFRAVKYTLATSLKTFKNEQKELELQNSLKEALRNIPLIKNIREKLLKLFKPK